MTKPDDVAETRWDVFVGHSPRDAGLLRIVAEALEESGLTPFTGDVPLEGPITTTVREAVAESRAGILLATPASVASPNLAFEAGLLMGWSKPIHVLHDGLPTDGLPPFLTQFQVHPLTQLNAVVRAIRADDDELTAPQREALVEVYSEMGLSTDRLLTVPGAINRLAEVFAHRSRRTAAGHTLARELIRLRKVGRLPELPSRPAKAG